ncbi:MAG: MFS transporter, partial [Pseudomonadota bacterium]
MTIELSNGAFRPATPPLPRVSQEIAITVVGCVLTGVTYGLIRLSLGQFLPDIRADLALSERWAGILSAGMFVGNCLALLVSALLTRARGPRVTAGLAGGLATLGLAGMVVASDPLLFAAAMLVAGSAAGLTIPPLVTAIQAVIRAGRRAVAITIVNAGTSVG